MAARVLARIDVRGLTGDLRAARSPVPPRATTTSRPRPREIVDDVRTAGDAALRELHRAVRRLPTSTTSRSPRATGDAALDRLDPGAARRARVRPRPDRRLARGAARARRPATSASGIHVRELVVPVDRAGCYVPGGRAPLASSVLMTAHPGARRRRAARSSCARRRGPTARSTTPCSPPPRSPASTSCTASAARRRSRRSRTAPRPIRPVDVIVGPGNAYVAEAKRAGRRRRRHRRLRRTVGGRDRRRRHCRPDARRRRPARAGRARARRRGRGRSRGTTPSPSGSTSRSTTLLATTTTSRGRRRDARVRRSRRPRRRTRAGDRRRQRDRARAPRADVRRRRRCSCRSCGTRARCSSASTHRR